MKITKIDINSTLCEVMAAIDVDGSGVAFILDGFKLAGIVTDGDIRRSMLSGANIHESIVTIMQTDYYSLPVGTSFQSIQEGLKKYKIIPILDESHRLVDVANLSSYHQISLVNPKFDGNELEYVTDCIVSGWISSQGKYVTQFEQLFSEYVGSSSALAVSNGTVALHLALVSLGIGPGDEVLVPDLTFAAPINAILYTGATPVLVDVDMLTMSINPHLAEKAITNKTKAIIAVHLYGHPANMDAILGLSKKFDLIVIEDCAEALGSRYKDKHVGIFGDAATFSFFGNKTITTGEGGMILFKDKNIHSRARVLRDHGMSPDRRYWHQEIGYNYRLTNIQAAVGVAQLERIDFFVEKKRWIAGQYNIHLKDLQCLQIPSDVGEIYNSYWLYTVILLNEHAFMRNSLIDFLMRNGVESRPVFYPLHKMPPYLEFKNKNDLYSVSSYLSNGGISLPSSTLNSEADILRVCNLIRKFLLK